MKSPSILLSLVAAVAMTFGISTSTVHAQVCAGDVNGDHVVNGADLAILLGNWGGCVGPTWATVLEWAPDATVVTNVTLRNAITKSRLPWRVRDNSSNIEMLLIPAGTFMMGCSAATQYACNSNESPTHQVTLTNAFYMGRYEVTQTQWTAKMPSNPSYFQPPNSTLDTSRPVEQVSWDMIASGSTSFMSLTGLRLPTEAEWEYAYRAGTTTAFHSYPPATPPGFDDATLLYNIAWYHENAWQKTHAVGGKAANALGLYDMAGNVSEWCQDWYGLYSSETVTNPTGPADGLSGLLRGGGWYDISVYCRASARVGGGHSFTSNFYGFRVARTPSSVEVCAGDINNDRVVDGADLAILLGNWGSCTSWATVLAWEPDAAVVTDATLRLAIIASGLPWRVRDNGTNIEMLLVPAGTFTMGCSASAEYGCYSDESPRHQVTLTNAFYMGRTEVTQAQWQAKMENNPSYFTGYPDSALRPVEQVSWNMVAGADGFMSGTGLRLPTEAEWEYAYRAGTTTAFHSYPAQPTGFNDDALLSNIAWYDSNSGYKTHAVGGKEANALGLYDMSGNVWEWCQDWYGDTYYPSSPLTNPTGPETGTSRLVRGGFWGYRSDYCRASVRGYGSTVGMVNTNGFRVARTP